MSDDENIRRKRPGRRSDARTVRRFLQELSWLLSNYEGLDFGLLSDLAAKSELQPTSSILEFRSERNTAAAALVGILPDVFTDESLFPSNEDIADFADQALGVIIPRWSKKSKYEIIGHVVCHTSVAGEERLRRVVEALERLTKNRERATQLISENKAKGMSWNELIQRLIAE